MKSSILLIAPRHYVEQVKQYYRPTSVQLDFCYQETIAADMDAFFGASKTWQYDGYIGTVDDSALVAAYLNTQRGIPAPSPEAIATLQDKYLSRRLQRACGVYSGDSYTSADIDYIPDEAFPLFAKPRHATMSWFAQRVRSRKHARMVCQPAHRDIVRRGNAPWYRLYEHMGIDGDAYDGLDDFTFESLQSGSIQVTLDGYMHNGVFTPFGVTKSVFRPNRHSFKRFDFPYRLPEKCVHDMVQCAERTLQQAQIDHTLCNIEYKIDPSTYHISLVEINLRTSPQFIYPITYVTGVNPLDVAIDIMLGRDVRHEPPHPLPHRACSVCDLRRPADAVVTHVPDASEMQWLPENYPGSFWEPYAVEGQRLSDMHHDSRTYRYGQVIIPHKPSQPVRQYAGEVESKIASLMGFAEV